jgi:hypothetical protein
MEQIQIMVKVSEDVANALNRQSPATPESEGVEKAARKLGIRLKPVLSDGADHPLASFFIVELSDPTAVDHILRQLNNIQAVEAAYAKPLDELP